MHVIFLDGESKSGKTAVGRSIFLALQQRGVRTRLLVAGHYFRHLTLLTLRQAAAGELAGKQLERAVRAALGSEQLLRPVEDPRELEQPDVEGLVSTIAEFGFVQQAAAAWRQASASQALTDGVEILLFDGRNLRAKLHDWLTGSGVGVALELIIYCRPEVAAARYVSDAGETAPTAQDLAQATQAVLDRRQRDRERAQAAYIEPENPVPLVVGRNSVDEALSAAFASDVQDPPRPIRFDNSEVPRADGLRTVTDLALKAVDKIIIP